MDEVARYAAAWKDRRRRFFVFKATQIAGVPILLGAAYLSDGMTLRASHSLFAIPIFQAMPIWLVGYVAAGVWLNRFRCPRCGKLYYWRLQLSGYMKRQMNWRSCRHCGLTQDGTPWVQLTSQSTRTHKCVRARCALATCAPVISNV